jgi:hypothetical protein
MFVIKAIDSKNIVVSNCEVIILGIYLRLELEKMGQVLPLEEDMIKLLGNTLEERFQLLE